MLQKLLPFVSFLQDFRKVERIIYYPGSSRKENDAEHACQLALVAWYIIEKKGLDLDIGNVMKYALVHDLVEIYAGDTIPFDHESVEVQTKKQRESEALEKIQQQFPEVPNMRERIVGYENQQDKEAKFVYALDKVLPIMNTLLDKGRALKAFDVSRENLQIHMKKTIVDKDISLLAGEISDMLDEHSDRFP